MIKRKTTTLIIEEYSYNGIASFFKYKQEEKVTMKNLMEYALKDIKKLNVPGTTSVQEDGINLSFNVQNQDQKDAYMKILEQSLIDITNNLATI